MQMYGRSGFSEVGVNPLSWETVNAWQQATGRQPTPAEVDALFQIDHALSYRGEGK